MNAPDLTPAQPDIKEQVLQDLAHLSARAVGWRKGDLDKWVSERVSVGGRHD